MYSAWELILVAYVYIMQGGTGAIWKKVAALLPADKQQYSQKVTSIDAAGHSVTLADGRQIKYNKVRRFLM